MTVRITKPILGGSVCAIASKSEAHRLLICAALADSATHISCPERSEDIDATARCLRALGAGSRYYGNGFIITPIDRDAENQPEYALDCGESGSTLRFLLPVCGSLFSKTVFNMGGRLPKRPLSELCDEMAAHGCSFSNQGSSPLVCMGRLESGTFTLPGNVSSQFVSGLLFALPLLSGDSRICVTGVLESRPYVDMTLDALQLYGVEIIEEEQNVFSIAGNQTFCSPQNARVGGDWSNAAFWLSAGAIGQNSVTCTNLDPASRQGDRAIAELLSRFGARVLWGVDYLTVSPGALRGIDVEVGDTPDLAPALAAVASIAEGKTVIRNAGRLRSKESDRLRAIASFLTDLGADISETSDGLTIIGKKTLKGGETWSYGDHRIAMSAAIVSARCDEPVVIRGAEAVRKSYQGFFEDFCDSLGGEIEIVKVASG
ncbi:MAG: 3-phosphoshikimate 1-carboxyvinyltransferase [Oscillospiraceae bacterium]|nr:3-phosphoshikimate 1-carboxyvinyltransferase [Oscillospiraceae bacterium]